MSEHTESVPEFGNDLDGRVARSLHAALRTIDRLQQELDFREAVIAELRMAVLVRQAMLDALVPERKP